MKNLKSKKLSIISLILALLMLLSVSFSACGDRADDDKKHVCESKCEVCGKCTNIDCDKSVCKDKCFGHYYSVTLSQSNAKVVFLNENVAPSDMEMNSKVSFIATLDEGYSYLSVMINGVPLTAVNAAGDVYEFTVTCDCKIEVLGYNKSLALTDATVELYNGKICYVLKGKNFYYTLDEIRGFYFDFEKYGDYVHKGYESFYRVYPSFDVKLDGDNFAIYVDISKYPAETCWIPHFLSASSDGDVKVGTSVGKRLKVGDVYYIITNAPYGIDCVEITRGGVINVSDTAPPAINEVTKHEYFKTTEIPRIDIKTDGGLNIDDESLVKGWKVQDAVREYDYVGASVSVSNCEGYELTDVSAKVKVRGNYTSNYPKRPIRIKFDKKQKMCGLSGNKQFKNWVLLSEYKDSSMLRNSVAFYLGNSILNADGQYCSDFRYVEVYINGVYNGLYLLCEQQEDKKGRVELTTSAIDPEEEPDNPDLKNVKIGYFIEYDGYYYTEDDLECFTINYSALRYDDFGRYTPTQNGFVIKSDVYFEEQRDFIKKCVQNIWNIVYDATYKDHTDVVKNPFYTLDEDGNKVVDTSIKTAREAVERVIDVNSLVDVFILNELCADADISWSSFYMSLDMSASGNKKLTFTAPWDFDSALGNIVADTDKILSLTSVRTPNPWLAVCAREPWLWTHVQAKWNALKSAGVFEGVIEMIDYFATSYVDVYAKNYDKWSECLGRKIEGQQLDLIATFTSQKQAAEYLKIWLETRITNFGNLIDDKVTSLLS